MIAKKSDKLQFVVVSADFDKLKFVVLSAGGDSMRLSMKLGTTLLPSILLICFACALSFAQAKGPAPGSPDAVIRSFYKWYVHALNQNSDPFTKQRTIMRRYVSERLIQEIDKVAKGPDGLDGDYFIDAQDWDKDWEKNIVPPVRVI